MGNMSESFLSCDWGTSRFRLRLIDVGEREIRAERTSNEGVASLLDMPADDRPRHFAEVLQRHVDQLAGENGLRLEQTPIVISGMASSSIGWRELPYGVVPFSLSGDELPLARLDEEAAVPSQAIVLCSGVRSPDNVMRGEEIEVIGLNALFPELLARADDLWVVLPGTHSKHVRVQQRSIVEFHTHMTGELFHLLAGHSSLRHARDGKDNGGTVPSEQNLAAREAFAEGVDLAGRANVGENLFQVRVRQLLRGNDPSQSRSFLSGLLIGNEVRCLLERSGRRGVLLLCASPELSQSYRAAFDQIASDQEVIVLPADEVARLSAWGQLQLLRRAVASVPRDESTTDQSGSREAN